MKYAILLYLLLNPLFFIVGVELRSAQEIFYQFSSMFLIVSSMFFENRKVKLDSLNISLLAAVVVFLSRGVLDMFGSAEIVCNTVLGYLVYLACIRTLKKEDISWIIKGVTWFVIFTLIYLLGQYLGWDMRGQTMRGVEGGVVKCSIFGIKSIMGVSYSAWLLPIVALTPVGLLLLFPIALSYSSGAVLGAGIGLMFFMWYRKRIVFWLLIPVVLVSSWFYLDKMDNPMGMQKTRIPMWGMVIQDSFKKPYGFGLDSFRNPYNGGWRYYKFAFNNTTVRAVKDGDNWNMQIVPGSEFEQYVKDHGRGLDWWDNPHNEFIQIFYEGGIQSLAVFGVFLYFLWLRFHRCKRGLWETAFFASIITILVSSMTQFPLHLARTGNFVPVILGFFYITSEVE